MHTKEDSSGGDRCSSSAKYEKLEKYQAFIKQIWVVHNTVNFPDEAWI